MFLAIAAVFVTSLLSLSPRVVHASDLDLEALCAYGAGRFADAAVRFERAAQQPGASAASDYFLGRSLRELGLGGLAELALGRAEAAGDPQWRQLARRELARLAFERGEVPAVHDLADPEIRYFAGLSAARQGRWRQAIELLGEIEASHPRYPFARYARAQASAADGDLRTAVADLALAIRHAPPPPKTSSDKRLESRDLLEPIGGESVDLRVVFAPMATAVSLADRAELLRGKILYLEGRTSEARSAFAAIRADGPTAIESARGLLLTGDVDAAAARADPKRPAATALLYMTAALAAERSDDLAKARTIRVALRELVRARLSALARFAAQSPLARDLVAFAAKLGLARAETRWPEEEMATGISCSFGPLVPASAASFQPSDELFYDLWTEVQANPRLARLLEVGAASARLDVDLSSPVPTPRRPFWSFWTGEKDDVPRVGLLVLRLTELEFRATNEGVLALGSVVGSSAATGSPARTTFGTGKEILDSMQARNRALGREIAAELESVIADSLRARMAFLERIDADNESSLARLYSRYGSELH